MPGSSQKGRFQEETGGWDLPLKTGESEHMTYSQFKTHSQYQKQQSTGVVLQKKGILKDFTKFTGSIFALQLFLIKLLVCKRVLLRSFSDRFFNRQTQMFADVLQNRYS